LRQRGGTVEINKAGRPKSSAKKSKVSAPVNGSAQSRRNCRGGARSPSVRPNTIGFFVCQLSGVKRTFSQLISMSDIDPKRTSELAIDGARGSAAIKPARNVPYFMTYYPRGGSGPFTPLKLILMDTASPLSVARKRILSGLGDVALSFASLHRRSFHSSALMPFPMRPTTKLLHIATPRPKQRITNTRR